MAVVLLAFGRQVALQVTSGEGVMSHGPKKKDYGVMFKFFCKS